MLLSLSSSDNIWDYSKEVPDLRWPNKMWYFNFLIILRHFSSWKIITSHSYCFYTSFLITQSNSEFYFVVGNYRKDWMKYNFINSLLMSYKWFLCVSFVTHLNVSQVRKTHSEGGYGSIGYQYKWNRAEANKNLLRTHTTAVSARMLHKLAQVLNLPFDFSLYVRWSKVGHLSGSTWSNVNHGVDISLRSHEVIPSNVAFNVSIYCLYSTSSHTFLPVLCLANNGKNIKSNNLNPGPLICELYVPTTMSSGC